MKILFTDLDDTLLNSKSQVSPETKAFLDEFLADGNRLVLSSGRPLMSVMEVTASLMRVECLQMRVI